MLTTEFNMEDAIAVWKEEGHAEGVAEGEAKGKAEGKAEGIDILAKYLREGLSLEDALKKAKNSLKAKAGKSAAQ